MQVPAQFKYIFQYFDQSMWYLYPDFEQRAKAAVESLNLKGNITAMAYFNELINGQNSEPELLKLCYGAGAQFIIKKDESIINFLKLMRMYMN